jgi:hypothetical protein
MGATDLLACFALYLLGVRLDVPAPAPVPPRHLGIRVGHDLKYDNEPVRGFETTDTTTNLSLVLQLGQKR